MDVLMDILYLHIVYCGDMLLFSVFDLNGESDCNYKIN